MINAIYLVVKERSARLRRTGIYLLSSPLPAGAAEGTRPGLRALAASGEPWSKRHNLASITTSPTNLYNTASETTPNTQGARNFREYSDTNCRIRKVRKAKGIDFLLSQVQESVQNDFRVHRLQG